MVKAWDELRPGARRGVRRTLCAVLARCWAPVPAAFAAIGLAARKGLEECPSCGGDTVSPLESHPVREGRRALRLRCGQCGLSRIATVTNAEARDLEGALHAHRSAIERALVQIETLRMAEQVECFVEALHRDLIDASDFHPRPGARWCAR